MGGAAETVPNATLALRDQAVRRSSQTAFVVEDGDGDRRVTFEQFDQRVDAAALGLLAAGLEPGARVLVSIGARLEFLEAVYAAMRAGLTAVLVEPNLRGDALETLVELADCAAAIVDADANAVAAALEGRDLKARFAVDQRQGWAPFERLSGAGTEAAWPTELPVRHPAVAFATSGSTGTPKLIVKTHAHFDLMARYAPPEYTAYLPRAGEETGPYLVPTSLYHTSGLNAGVFLGVMRGWTGVILSGFQPSKMLVKLALHRCATVMCTPTQATACLRERDLIRALDFSALRSFRVAGGPSSGPLLTRLAQAFPTVEIINVYATTECAPCLGQHPGAPRQPLESCGRALPGVDVRIVDESGSDVERGELWLRSDLIAVGTILDEPRAQQLVDGEWYRTGDEFRRDDDGWLHFIGRQDDMFVCGGENVHPTEVERILCANPDVSEACVVGLPDEILGTAPAAAVVLTAGATATTAELAGYVADNAAPHLVPHRIRAIAEIPTLGPGKFDRARVRADLLGETEPAEKRPAGGVDQTLDEPEYEAIAAAWSEVLGVEPVDADVEFLAAGGDSIKAVRLVTQLSAHDLPITVVDLFERGTVRRLTEHAVAQRSGAAS